MSKSNKQKLHKIQPGEQRVATASIGMVPISDALFAQVCERLNQIIQVG